MLTTQTTRRASVRPAQVAPSPEPLRGEAAVAATIAILQRELDALRMAVASGVAPAPVKVSRETQEEERLLQVLREGAEPGPHEGMGQGLWLTDAQTLTEFSKTVTHTRARALAYARRVRLSLEPNPAVGKLAFWLELRP